MQPTRSTTPDCPRPATAGARPLLRLRLSLGLRPRLRLGLGAAALAGAMLLAACGTVGGPAAGAAWSVGRAGIAVPPPLPAGTAVDSHWGQRIPDPYRQLENLDDPAVQGWMRQQAQATNAILASLPGRTAMLERIRSIEAAAGGVTSAVARTAGGRLFFLRRNPGENVSKLVWRDGPEGADHIAFDPEAGMAGGPPRAVMDFSPSPDGRRLAYAVQSGGGEIGTLHVIDVASGRPLITPIDRIRYADASWLEDGSGFFYSRLREGYETLPATERFKDRRSYLRLLDGAGTEHLVFSAGALPEWNLSASIWSFLFPIPGTDRVAAIVAEGVDRNQMLFTASLAQLRAGRPVWQRLVGQRDEVHRIRADGRHFYLKSARGAARFQILRLPVDATDISAATPWVSQSAGAIGDIGVARDALYFTRREGVDTQLYRVPKDNAAVPQRVALPFEGAVRMKAARHDADGVLVEMAGWTRAFKDFIVDPATTAGVRALPLAAAGAHDAPADIESREVMVRSHDGVMVPLSLVYRKGTKLDGRNPTIVYGYGAYGVTDDPFFNPRIYAWLQSGGVWATAHVRGGGVFGIEWHEAGRKATKPNTWKDTIAVAEWLVAQGWTQPARMGVLGGSAGGILVGRAITERPDLFAAAVPSVGVMDAMRFETEPNGPANIPEFGTVKDEAGFRALLDMSSYHHLRDGARYPAVMAVHGVNDIRVSVWHSTKFASRLARASTSGKPVLLRLEYDAGHGQGSSRAQLQQRSADTWSFLLWQFGEPGFQPRP